MHTLLKFTLMPHEGKVALRRIGVSYSNLNHYGDLTPPLYGLRLAWAAG